MLPKAPRSYTLCTVGPRVAIWELLGYVEAPVATGALWDRICFRFLFPIK